MRASSVLRLVAIALATIFGVALSWLFFFGSESAGDGAAAGTTSTLSSTTTQEEPATTDSVATTSTVASTTISAIPPRGELVIHAVGDVNLDTDVLSVFLTEGFEHAWSGLDGLFLEDDLTIVNLECSPSPDGPREPKEFVFGCNPDAYPAAIAAGVDVMSLGNNHSQDHGKEAMLVGRQHLMELGLNPVGAGIDDAEAGAPALFDVKGWRIAVIGFGGVVPWDGWLATPDRAGMRDGDDIPSMVEAVAAAKEQADIVIVVIHWGVELDLQPRPEDRERAIAMIDAGADAIFGHHPHRLQPLEFVSDRPVAWSLGNFVWPNLSTAGSTTAIARVVVSPEGAIDACLIPAFIESRGHPVITGEPSCGPGKPE